MADIPVLVCTAGALMGKRISVPDGGLNIGRSPENHVIITDDGVSRFHVRLLYDNGSLWLQDAGSRNGVFVNDVRVTGHKALKVGDEVTVANHVFQVSWADNPNVSKEHRRAVPDAKNSENPTTDGDATTETDTQGKRPWFWPFS